jgi:tRNA nucleotidyltransferase (CCA-adding enzyme)
MGTFIGHDELAAFAASRVNLPPDDAQAGRDRVTYLRERLEKYIDEHPDFNLVKMLHAGSVAKGTALKTINDMDVAVYVRRAEAPSGGGLVPWLVDRLREAYKGILEPDQIEAGTHCATVTFKSGGIRKVDVVPILYESDPQDRGYLVAKDTGDRILTSVRLHLDFVRKRKKANPDHYAQMVRFIKWWVRRQRNSQSDGFKFKSFMVELLVSRLADDGIRLSDYEDGMEAVFAYIVRTGLRERIAFKDVYAAAALPAPTGCPIEIFDPVNPENNVAFRYTEADRQRIVAAAEEALGAITEARYATTKARAVACWQVVLGPGFQG